MPRAGGVLSGCVKVFIWRSEAGERRSSWIKVVQVIEHPICFAQLFVRPRKA